MATLAIPQHKRMAMGELGTPKGSKTQGVRPDTGRNPPVGPSKKMPSTMPKTT